MLESQHSETVKDEEQDDLRTEYGEEELRGLLQTGVRGKYTARYRQGINLVKIAPDVAAAFPTEQAVNDALRRLLAVGAVTTS